MEKNVWFKAKTYGYGWYPATWEGWLILILFILAEILIIEKIKSLIIIPISLILVTILIIISYKKGEKPKWRWGKNKNS